MRLNAMSKMSLVAACVALGVAASSFGAVTMPYQAFTQPTSTAADFTPSGTASTDTWAVNSGVLEHQFVSDGGGSSTSGQFLATSGVAGTSFTQKVDMKFPVINTGIMRWETRLVVLATSTSLPARSETDNWYAVTLTLNSVDWGHYPTHYADSIGISGCGGAGYSWDPPLQLGSSDLSSNVNTNDTYRLAVSGTYGVDNRLSLVATVTDLTTSTVLGTFSSAPLSTPSTGTYFGMQETGWYGSGGTTQFSNYDLRAVPEPVTMSVLGVTAVVLMARRRKTA